MQNRESANAGVKHADGAFSIQTDHLCVSIDWCHSVAELFFTCGSKAKHLLPYFLRFHAKVNLDRRCRLANPLDHLAIHPDALWLKIAQLTVWAEHLLA